MPTYHGASITVALAVNKLAGAGGDNPSNIAEVLHKIHEEPIAGHEGLHFLGPDSNIPFDLVEAGVPLQFDNSFKEKVLAAGPCASHHPAVLNADDGGTGGARASENGSTPSSLLSSPLSSVRSSLTPFDSLLPVPNKDTTNTRAISGDHKISTPIRPSSAHFGRADGGSQVPQMLRKTLTVSVDFDVTSFNRTNHHVTKDGHDIKVEVFINGQFQSGIIRSAGRKTREGMLKVELTGYRTSPHEASAWIIQPPDSREYSKNSPVAGKQDIKEEAIERWTNINGALAMEARIRGADALGVIPKTAEYLLDLCKMDMPDSIEDMYPDHSRLSFGLVDVVITAGKCYRRETFLSGPERHKPPSLAIENKPRYHDVERTSRSLVRTVDLRDADEDTAIEEAANMGQSELSEARDAEHDRGSASSLPSKAASGSVLETQQSIKHVFSLPHGDNLPFAVSKTISERDFMSRHGSLGLDLSPESSCSKSGASGLAELPPTSFNTFQLANYQHPQQSSTGDQAQPVPTCKEPTEAAEAILAAEGVRSQGPLHAHVLKYNGDKDKVSDRRNWNDDRNNHGNSVVETAVARKRGNRSIARTQFGRITTKSTSLDFGESSIQAPAAAGPPRRASSRLRSQTQGASESGEFQARMGGSDARPSLHASQANDSYFTVSAGYEPVHQNMQTARKGPYKPKNKHNETDTIAPSVKRRRRNSAGDMQDVTSLSLTQEHRIDEPETNKHTEKLGADEVERIKKAVADSYDLNYDSVLTFGIASLDSESKRLPGTEGMTSDQARAGGVKCSVSSQRGAHFKESEVLYAVRFIVPVGAGYAYDEQVDQDSA